MDFRRHTDDALLRAYAYADGDRGTTTVDQECRRMLIVQEAGAEIERRGLPFPEPIYTYLDDQEAA